VLVSNNLITQQQKFIIFSKKFLLAPLRALPGKLTAVPA